MAINLTRSGLDVDWQAGLPFNNQLVVQFYIPTGLAEGEDPARAFDSVGNTHLWLLFAAGDQLREAGAAGEALYGLIKPWQGEVGDAFHDALCRGLWDADKRAPYNNAVFDLLPTWASHFYDPDSGTNWLGQSRPTALSAGSQCYRGALAAFRRGDGQQAGHALGLALHYLTDLTQPMHAANFTWLDSFTPGYHTDFERYAKAILHRIPALGVYRPILGTMNHKAFFHAVARYSKETYFARLCRPEWTRYYNEAARDFAVWEARVGGLVPRILGDAVQLTAQFLLLWFEEAQRGRRVLEAEPTSAPVQR